MITITVDMIVDIVAAHYDVDRNQLFAASKIPTAVRARQVVMWIARQALPHYSLPMIGRALGGRDHTTVLHGIERIELLASEDARLRRDLVAIADAVDTAREALQLAAVPAPADIDPLKVAARVLGDPRAATRLTVAELRALATATLVTEQERPEPEVRVVEREVRVPVLPAGPAVRRLRDLRRRYESDLGGRGERAARADLLAAIDAVAAAYDTTTNGGQNG